jgi:hypothetical protein
MTVEGDRYIGERIIGKIDSTEPGKTQRLIDFPQVVIEVSCDPADKFGTLNIIRGGRQVSITRLIKSARERIEGHEPVIFSGEEQIVATYLGNKLSEQIILRHRKGDPENPPYRRERVPLDPTNPGRSARVAREPEREPEKTLLVSGVRR